MPEKAGAVLGPGGSVRGVLSILIAVASFSPGAAAQDSDLVILRNGNPVVGEVKSLRRGSLSFDTEEMDSEGEPMDDDLNADEDAEEPS